MTDTETLPAENRRLNGLDVARFVALVGMVIVNFSIVMGAEGSEGLVASFSASLSGRAAATFVVLAGIGLGLAHTRASGGSNLWLMLRRAAYLAVLGLVNMLVFPADILHYYAVYFVFGAVLLSVGSRRLTALIVAINLVFVALIFTLDYEAGWDWSDYTYSGFWTVSGFFRNLFFNGWHPVFPWLGFLLFGILLSRVSLGSKAVQVKLIVLGLLALVLAEYLSFLLTDPLNAIDTELAFLVTTAPVPPMPLYSVAGTGAASLVIGLCLLCSARLEKWGVSSLVAPAGKQTLTLYIAHVIVGMGTLEFLGLLGGQSAESALAAAVLFSLLAAVYAWIWARYFKRGPFEALMRAIAG